MWQKQDELYIICKIVNLKQENVRTSNIKGISNKKKYGMETFEMNIAIVFTFSFQIDYFDRFYYQKTIQTFISELFRDIIHQQFEKSQRSSEKVQGKSQKNQRSQKYIFYQAFNNLRLTFFSSNKRRPCNQLL